MIRNREKSDCGKEWGRDVGGYWVTVGECVCDGLEKQSRSVDVKQDITFIETLAMM